MTWLSLSWLSLTWLSQVTGHRLDQITVSSTPLLGGIRTHNFNGDRHRLIARVVVNSTTRWSLPWQLPPVLSMFSSMSCFWDSRVVQSNMCIFFYYLLIMIWICCWRSRLVGWVHINRTCTGKPNPGFSSVFLNCSIHWGEKFWSFCGIGDNRCLNFLFIMKWKMRILFYLMIIF